MHISRSLLLLTVFLAYGGFGKGPARADEGALLHSLFTDHMVLQRQVEVPVWGSAQPGQRVLVQFAHQMAVARADADGQWRVALGPFNAGGPYELKVEAETTQVVRDVLVGDVWLCSGQSNMEWPVSLSNDPDAEIAAANHPQIRLFTVPKRISPQPVTEIDAAWQVCAPGTVADFSAVGYFFGRQLQQDLDVPIGLIDSSWGGTIAEAWTSAGALKDLASFRAPVAEVTSWGAEAEDREAQFQRRLLEWWAENDDGSQPGAAWSDAEEDDSRWARVALPGLIDDQELPDFDGIVWFRKEFSVPKAWQGEDLEFHLAKIDDIDTSYVNGQEIGSMSNWNAERVYRVPAAQLRPEGNLLAIRVLDTGGGGGVHGAPNDLYFRPVRKSLVGSQPLSGWWRYRVGGDLKESGRPPQKPGASPNVSTVLFNGMIAPLVTYGIKGAIWYQGESNANRPTEYRTLLPTMIRDWRQQFGLGDFPFLIVQLANFMQRESEPTNPTWAALREAQSLAAAQDPNTGLATIIDIGEADDIHPRNKQDVGKRLAMAAKKIAYGQSVVPTGPVFRSMTVSGRTVLIDFDHVGAGLVAKGGQGLTGFAIAGADGKYVWADARIRGRQVLVSSPEVNEPKSVRYAWANNPACNLYNQEGLPAEPFRTDGERLAPPTGFTALFDGETLDGFQQINGTANYEVVDGTILGTTTAGSPNSFLCTDTHYEDFELQFEVKLMNPELNSGVQVRSNSYENYRKGRVHGYQVEISSNGNAGFVYDEARRGWLSKDRTNAAARSAFKSDSWNHYRILCVGDVIKTWVNGVPVASVRDSFTSRGFIGLQVHGVRGDPHWQVAWRNLWIREIDEDPSVAIFDGESLAGWHGKPNGWYVDEGGSLARRTKSGYLWTEATYEDFELSLEFKVSEKCNSGIFFRTDPSNPVQGGFEIQLLDSYGREEVGKRDSGALYDALKPRINAARPAGEWNECTIKAVGSQVWVRLNGELVIDTDLSEWTTGNQNPDGSRNKFKTPLSQLPRVGHIGLQDHGKPVWFRKIRIARL